MYDAALICCKTQHRPVGMQMEYLLCYACAGPHLQLCALHASGWQAIRLGHPHAIDTLRGKLDLIGVVVRLYAVLKAQAHQLPSSFLQLGYIRHTTFSSVEYLDGFVIKRVAILDAWPVERIEFMTRVYKDTAGCPYLIQAMHPPQNKKLDTEYVVHLEPVGVGTIVTDQAELKTCIRWGLQA